MPMPEFDLMTIVNVVLVVAAVGSLFGGMILKIAADWVALAEVPYLRACFTVFIAYALNILLTIPVDTGTQFLVAYHPFFALMTLVMLPVGFFVQAGVIYWRLELSFGYSILVTLAMILIAFILVLVFGFGFVLINVVF